MTKEGKGSLFFSKEQPEVSGFLVIDGVDYEIVGWRPSSIRADIKATQTTERDEDDSSRSGARKCDTP